jgi:phage-related protein
MAKTLTVISSNSKGAIATADAFIVLIDIILAANGANPAQTVRLARNVEDVVFKGNTYQAFAFEFDVAVDAANGQLQSIALRVQNITRLIHGYLEQYDGGVGAKVHVYVINTNGLNPEPDIEAEYEVMDATADKTWASFTLGAKNPLRDPFPRFIYLANHCIHTFNTPTMQAALDPLGQQCGYSGADPTCSKTLEGFNGCRHKANQSRFGGQAGITTAGFRAAQIQ